MFEDFYHLTQNPFQINTDPRFLWLGEKHKEALAILQYGVIGNKSFLLLTGDVGTGKTTLINALLKGQGDDTLIATIQDPDLSTLDLYNYIAYSFKMPDRFDTKGKFLANFRKFLEKNYYTGKKVLLVIDEAQRAKKQILEDIRVLSNIEVDGNKLINIFFVGQNELNDILLQDENKAIRQRITISYNIKPLTWIEVGKYIQFRLFKAGANGKIFNKEAVNEIFKFTNGYPRLINILCDRCLLTGFVHEKKIIDKNIVKECCAEIDISMPFTATKQNTRHENGQRAGSSSAQPFSLPMRYFFVCLLVIFLAPVWFFHGEIKNIFSQHFSGSGRAYEGGISASAPPIRTPEISPAKHSTHKKILNKMPQNVQGAVAHKENQTAQDAISLFPPSDKQLRPSSVAIDTNSKVKTAIFSTSSYQRKMQIFFRPDSISPEPEYIEALKVFSDRFIELGRGRIVVRGYTDKSGSVKYNRKLAKFRADIIKTFLEGRGVDVAKITTIGVISGTSSAGEIPFSSSRKVARKVELEIILNDSSDSNSP